jgi:hypothetical protein
LEWTVRKQLQENEQTLKGLYPGQQFPTSLKTLAHRLRFSQTLSVRGTAVAG